MARGGGGRSGGSRSVRTSAKSRTVSTRQQKRPVSSVPARTSPAAQPAKTNVAQKPVSNPTTNPSAAAQPGVPGRSGSVLGNIAQNAAGTAIGVVGAHAIMGAFGGGAFGGARTPEQVQEVVQKEQSGPCAQPMNFFLKCVDENQSNVSSCQWIYNQFQQCKQNPNEYMGS